MSEERVLPDRGGVLKRGWTRAFIVLVSVGLLGCGSEEQEEEFEAPRVEVREAMDLPLTPLGGGAEVTLAELRGNVVLLNFWGTWCGPCLEELPGLEDLWQQFDSRDDFALVAIACNPDGTPEDHALLQSFVARTRTGLPIYTDASGRMAPLFVLAFPTNVVLDREGRVVRLWMGVADDTLDQVQTTIERELRSSGGAPQRR